MRNGGVLIVTVLTVIAAVAPGAAADPRGQVARFPVGAPESFPSAIAAGPDGNVWFTYGGFPRHLGRITPDGAVTEFTAGISPHFDGEAGISAITAGPDGNVWYADYSGAIGRVTPDGAVTEFRDGITPESNPSGITAGSDGNLWFTESSGNQIGRITPEGVVTEFPTSFAPSAITAGPDDNAWFIEDFGTQIGRITPKGKVTTFDSGVDAALGGITAGCDGNLWFAMAPTIGSEEGATYTGSGLGRITPKGKVTDFSDDIAPDAGTSGIAAGPDGNVWFTESRAGTVGRIGSGPAAKSRPKRGPRLPAACPKRS